MKLQDFPSSIEFCIENESKVDEIKIKVRNEPNRTLWGKNQKCIESKNLGFDPALIHALFSNRPGSYPNIGKFQWLGSF